MNAGHLSLRHSFTLHCRSCRRHCTPGAASLGLGTTTEACLPCLQGLGAPACARIMTTWWSDTERGTVWGVWTASNNVGGFLAPMLVGNVARNYGWRYIALPLASVRAAVCVPKADLLQLVLQGVSQDCRMFVQVCNVCTWHSRSGLRLAGIAVHEGQP